MLSDLHRGAPECITCGPGNTPTSPFCNDFIIQIPVTHFHCLLFLLVFSQIVLNAHLPGECETLNKCRDHVGFWVMHLLPGSIYICFCQDHRDLTKGWGSEVRLQYFWWPIPRIHVFGTPTQSLRSFPRPLPSTSSKFCPPPSSSLSPSKSLFSFPASHLPASSWYICKTCLTSMSFPPPPDLGPTNLHCSLALHYIQTHSVLNFVQLFYLQERGPLNLPLTKIFPTPIFSIFLGLYLLWFLYHFIKILEGRGENYIVNE